MRLHQDDANDANFSGSIPEMYERHLVPLLFAPYAADIVERARAIATCARPASKMSPENRSPSAAALRLSDAVTGFYEGSPLRSEILARDARRLPEVVALATRALQAAFKGDTIDGNMRAYVFGAR